MGGLRMPYLSSENKLSSYISDEHAEYVARKSLLSVATKHLSFPARLKRFAQICSAVSMRENNIHSFTP